MIVESHCSVGILAGTTRFRLTRWIRAAIIAMLATPFVTAQAEPPATGLADTLALQRLVDDARIRNGVPGVSLSVEAVSGDRVTVTSGLADIALGQPMTDRTRMPSGSVGKSLVALTVLTLARDSLLDLDAPIQTWLGDRPWFPSLPNGKGTSLRMLLHHSSGIPNHVDDPKFERALQRQSLGHDLPADALIAWVLRRPPLFAPGAGFHYSDTNYLLVSLVIERVTGKSWYDAVRARVLEPLGLRDTTAATKASLPGLANGYVGAKPMMVAGRLRINPQWEGAGGGFATTSGDLAALMLAVGAGRILDGTWLAQMQQVDASGDGSRYGLGLEIEQSLGGPRVGHTGEFPGYLSCAWYYPGLGLAIAAQFNQENSAGVERLGECLAEDVALLMVQNRWTDSASVAARGNVEKASLEWLHQVDTGDYNGSWDAFTPAIQGKLTREEWRRLVTLRRRRHGQPRERVLVVAGFTDSAKKTMVLHFDVMFGPKDLGRETLAFVQDDLGQWRVSSFTQ